MFFQCKCLLLKICKELTFFETSETFGFCTRRSLQNSKKNLSSSKALSSKYYFKVFIPRPYLLIIIVVFVLKHFGTLWSMPKEPKTLIENNEISQVLKLIKSKTKSFENPIVTEIGEKTNSPFHVLISC